MCMGTNGIFYYHEVYSSSVYIRQMAAVSCLPGGINFISTRDQEQNYSQHI